MLAIPLVLALVAIAALLWAFSGSPRARLEVEQMQRMYPAAFEVFRLSVDPKVYAPRGRVNYAKMALDFRAFLDKHAGA
ncbi:hypothetical protein QCE62_00305 [Caballeronia sp. LZ033]|uniref:hypothetical protein n=1 Tax=Caballeronia sp. LZ033 TaxID=3038566 RepID=UPI00285F181A|nr:hypothetical protein [Caballeronia sp. LZ033]MDR5812029.1 hypothetical protein [Caballeronia sp. LZ033]